MFWLLNDVIYRNPVGLLCVRFININIQNCYACILFVFLFFSSFDILNN